MFTQIVTHSFVIFEFNIRSLFYSTNARTVFGMEAVLDEDGQEEVVLVFDVVQEWQCVQVFDSARGFK